MTDETVTLTLSKTDAQRLLQGLDVLVQWAQEHTEQGWQRLDDDPRDEGHAARRQQLRGTILGMAALARDSERLRDGVRAVLHPPAERAR